ncbi:hypothetical protein CQA53_04890 [Helicobacter didelphidarum]|uniref:Probable membrane transporter protein n=1 Tax=Helicobacter didelphidarum TaxID=2040648 RepID=A0A3D8ILS2_9HELI|nr:TSUP family transporter [Helicobacter didelphidarum]RDU65960.1 hypothetical protein CQA53_04890 [Helicobacter didelphidarum]
MEFEIHVHILLILFAVAFVAGFIDAIAGGGGMITIPALFLVGIPPHEALGTNKLQSSFGSFSATLHFYKTGHLHIKENILHIFLVFFAALCGTILLNFFDASFLAKWIPFLLIIFALYFLFSPKIQDENKHGNMKNPLLLLFLICIGFYDGFFGPGTGSFFMFALIACGGLSMKDSLARTKLYNFTSNIAALCVFMLHGQILFLVGFIMGIGQFIGANLGSKTALKHGAKIIKPLVVTISLLVCTKLLYEQYFL